MTQILDYRDNRNSMASRFLHLAPLAFITYGLAFLDRVNYGSASSRLEKSLEISGSLQKNLIAASFFLGYFVFQIPGASYASNRSVKKLIFWALILWGALSALTGVITNIPMLLIDRMLLGAVEGVVLPAMLIYLTRWFTKQERSRVNSLLMLANPITMMFASALCGFLIDYFDNHRVGRFAGWQMMFIVEGAPSIIWAFIWWYLAYERPADASWLSEADAAGVQQSLEAEQRGMNQVKNYWGAFSDRRVILLSVMFYCMSFTSYGVMMWLPKIVEVGTKQGVARSGLITAFPYLIATLTMPAMAYISDRTLLRKPFIFGAQFLGAAAMVVAYLSQNHFWIAFAGLTVVASCIYIPCPPLWAWMTEMLPKNVVGEAMALVNSAGALGGFTGTLLVGMLMDYFQGTAYLFEAFALAAAGTLTVLAGTQMRRKVEARELQPVMSDAV